MFGLVSTAIGQPTGEILFEWWYDIGGTAISDLTGNPDFPDNPDDGEFRTSFDGIVDGPDNYGTRVRGWLYPPEDGEYTFWIAGDDFMNLLLSTDDDPANATLIAEVPGWTSYLQWDSYPEQQSVPITLAAGGKYYIEALGKEGGGGDSLTAGWVGPGIGEDITIIDGAYLSPAEPSPSLKKAKNPDPADGAVDFAAAVLGWGPGFAAVSHVVYLNDEMIAETDLGNELAAAALDPGAAYTWRVDEVLEDGTVITGDTWSFTTLPLEAHFPSPADGAIDVVSPAALSWTLGKDTILNYVYFGTDMALVEARDPSTAVNGGAPIMGTSVNVGELALFTTYYWAVDEFTPPPVGTVAGPTWSFSSEGYVPILQGSQDLHYHNHGEPYVSELAIDAPADITAGGKVTNLVLNFQGAAPILDVDEDTGTYAITGEGYDVWNDNDAFHYVYMQLTGDGEISARVVSNGTGSNGWAKGGVMIRETTDPGSKHMIMGMTGGEGGGIAFQGRIETAGNSSSFHDDVVAAPPYWVRLVREGNNISGYYSADGVDWTLYDDPTPDAGAFAITNPQPVEMAETVLIGLFVTSHADEEQRTYTFDNVDIQGNVDNIIVSEDVASESQGNDADPIYVALEDATGAVAMINHPDPAATQLTETQTWTIPVAAFGGVDLAAISKVIVGVGNGEPGGEGDITVSDVKVVDNDEVDIDIVLVSDMYDEKIDGSPDDLDLVKLLLDAGYVVDYTAGAAMGDGYWRTLDDEKIATLNAARLVIVSRNADSGSYDNDDAVSQWNSITSPLLLSSTHIVRSSRWKWVDSTSLLDGIIPVMELADGTAVVAIDDTVGASTYIDAAAGNGTVLATGEGLPWIIKWDAGVEYYDGAGQTAGGPRVFFVAGAQEVDIDASDGDHDPGRGEWNLTAEGEAIYLNTVADLMNPNLIPNGGLEDDLSGAPWSTYGDASLEVVHELVDAAVPEGPIEGDHCLHVTVNSAGANFWDAGLQSAGKVFEAGKSYTLSVWLKSKSGPFEINIKPERAADPWEAHGEQRVILTEEWAEYTVNTGVITDTVEPASITFHIAFAAGEFYLDNAVFKEDL